MNLMHGNKNFIWWVGVVEDRNDPEKLGRCKVRIFGYHTENLDILPKDKLPWAVPLQPITSAANSGVGSTPLGPLEGTWVTGWFLDGEEKQQPIMMGTIGGKPKDPNAQESAAQQQTQNNADAGAVQTTTNNNVIHDGNFNPLYTEGNNSTTNAESKYDVNTTNPGNPFNPSNDPKKSLNAPSIGSPEGFKDPNKVYPKTTYIGLPDTNKLATQDKSHVMFNSKANTRITGINIANNSKTWDEPEYAYAARYPYNQVIETETGHVIELDNTPNAERIHVYHKKGTYIEVDVNGSMVRKVVGDNFEIIDKNGHLDVRGAYTMTVSGATKILIENNADIEVDGDVNVIGHGSTTVESAKEIGVIGENIIVSAKESLSLVSDGPVNIQGSDIAMLAKTGTFAAKSAGDFALQSGGASTMSVAGGIQLLLDADIIKEQMGFINVVSNKLPVFNTPTPKIIVEKFPPDLTRPDTNADTYLFDSMEKGADAHKQAQIAANQISSNTDTPTAIDQATEPPNNLSGDPIDCEEFLKYSIFPDSLKLSNYYTLGSLTTRPAATSYRLTDNRGLTKAQIACNLKGLAVNVLDSIRDKYSDMVITSGFRATNHGSDHEVGAAADLQFTNHSYSEYYEIVQWIRDNVPYKQLLLEYKRKSDNTVISWIHIAYLSNQQSPMRVGTLFDNSLVNRGAFVQYA
jgi:Gp5 N-terminal OB domain